MSMAAFVEFNSVGGNNEEEQNKVSNLIEKACDLLRDEDKVEQSKYVKIFKEVNGEWMGKKTIGIYAAGI